MAATHIRSNSFPSRTHPVTDNLEEQLVRLRSSEVASTSSSAVCQKLGSLKSLYDNIDDWMQLSQTQHALPKDIEDLLDGSLRTLDVCSTLRDVLSMMKGCIQELESSLRRTKGSDSISGYLISRKNTRKLVSKTLKNLKKIEKQNVLNKASQDETTLRILREAELISISVFESVLGFLYRPKTNSSGWSVVPKLMSAKRVACEALPDANEVEALDAELLAFKSGKVDSSQVHSVLKQAEALESGIQETEEVLESIFRCLVKTRVSLLNSISH